MIASDSGSGEHDVRASLPDGATLGGAASKVLAQELGRDRSERVTGYPSRANKARGLEAARITYDTSPVPGRSETLKISSPIF
jgi:hypothetical protein